MEAGQRDHRRAEEGFPEGWEEFSSSWKWKVCIYFETDGGKASNTHLTQEDNTYLRALLTPVLGIEHTELSPWPQSSFFKTFFLP
jgi:hypothetical protein